MGVGAGGELDAVSNETLHPDKAVGRNEESPGIRRQRVSPAAGRPPNSEALPG